VATANDANPSNDTYSDATNVMNVWTPSPTGAGVRTPTPTWTPTIGVGPSASPTFTPARTATLSGATPTATPTGGPGPTPTQVVVGGNLGVRFVSTGRVNRGSTLYYSIVVVTYNARSVIPDVQATLTVPQEVLYLWAQPEPAQQPEAGANGGIVRWSLGNLTGLGNMPLQVAVRVRSDINFGNVFTATLQLTSGAGDYQQYTRTSYVGRIALPGNLSADNGGVQLSLVAPRAVRAGRPIRYTIKVRPHVAGDALQVEAILPSGVTFTWADVPPASLDPATGTLVWTVSHVKSSVLHIYGVVDPAATAGSQLTMSATVFDDPNALPLVVFANTTVR
jgi:hypothetical protein